MNHRLSMLLLAAVTLVTNAVACGGGTGGATHVDVAGYDPRCVAACKQATPEVDGAGAVCDAESQTLCLDECTARLADTTTTCGNCLVEDACLAPERESCFDSGPPNFCDLDSCTTSGPEGDCEYPQGDDDAYEACRRQVDPRTVVTCTARFRETADCTALCAP